MLERELFKGVLLEKNTKNDQTTKNYMESNVMQVKIKLLHPNAVVPKYAKQGDGCFDLTAVSKTTERGVPYIEYDTGLAFEIPDGYVGLVFPRSSVSSVFWGVGLRNGVGVIDSTYRGSVKLRFSTPVQTIFNSAFEYTKTEYIMPSIGKDEYRVGDRIGQMMIIPVPKIEFVEVDKLDITDRGDGGFGSTGR